MSLTTSVPVNDLLLPNSRRSTSYYTNHPIGSSVHLLANELGTDVKGIDYRQAWWFLLLLVIYCFFNGRRSTSFFLNHLAGLPVSSGMGVLNYYMCDWPFQKLFGHPRESQMYDSFQRDYFWLHMANNVYTVVVDCCQGPEKKQLINDDSPHNNFWRGAYWHLSLWTFEEQAKDDNWQPACTFWCRTLLKVNESYTNFEDNLVTNCVIAYG